eukprot:CAMPEP_0179229542 /NCGR_PEP_ID=MMETSP0797-20121207/10385_1 /TAXON_ID=47934 /ORGANISM="Dinophysis acuminata, Strain DAEP01" /LENGTH=343 /DNA_ID=CAMNT_0020936609 /DNA_START=67 /DNA_END=1098 /DNA_ORIENTATION=-
MSGQMVGNLDTSSIGLLHGVNLDYYGKRVAAASADNTVHIWDITDGQQKPCGVLRGHDGPVWKACWAHPKFGSLVATCGYDMKVIIWKEERGQWQMAYVDTSHQASVNDVEFCPWEYGLRLACASSDGTVSILTHNPNDQQWRRMAFPAHPCGAQTVSWAPLPQQDNATQPPTMRLATGGCDNCVAVWKYENEQWCQEGPLGPPHTDWVRAVAWRPDSQCILASAGWDKTAVIWRQEMEGQPWRQICKFTLADKVEGLAWSVTGSILAVSFGEGETVLYKETADGSYEEIGKVGEHGYTEVMNKVIAAAGFDAADQAAEVPQATNLSSELAAQQQAVLESFGM